MKWISSVGAALLVSLLAAAAVHFGFSGAFVGGGVAFGTTAYAGGLTAALTRERESASILDRLWFRVPFAVSSSVILVWLFRTVWLFELPFGEFSTTGHSPFFVIPVSGTSSVVLLESMKALQRCFEKDERVDSSLNNGS